MRSQTISTIRCECEDIFGAIVGISPAVPYPFAADIAERDLAENARVQVNTMVAILDRGKHQFGLRDVARIEIKRPDRLAREHFHRFQFPSVGLQLPIGQSLRVDRRVDRDHHFGQPHPHLIVVVSAGCERQRRRGFNDSSPLRYNSLNRPLPHRIVGGNDGAKADDRFDRTGFRQLYFPSIPLFASEHHEKLDRRSYRIIRFQWYP